MMGKIWQEVGRNRLCMILPLIARRSLYNHGHRCFFNDSSVFRASYDEPIYFPACRVNKQLLLRSHAQRCQAGVTEEKAEREGAANNEQKSPTSKRRAEQVVDEAKAYAPRSSLVGKKIMPRHETA